MNKIARYLIGIIFSVCCTVSYAQSEDAVVTHQDDLSVQFLRIIFGDVVNIITGQPLPSGGDGVTRPDSIMGAVMEVWNGVLLIIGTAFILWQTFSWLLEAAHTGRGKGAQNLLWPGRVIFALAAIAPLGLGYSGYQHGLFWASGHSIETANAMSDIVYDRLGSGESFAQAPIEQSNLQVASHLFESLVCLASVNNAIGELGGTENISTFSSNTPQNTSGNCDSDDPVRSCATISVTDQLRDYELEIGGNPQFVNDETGINLGSGACGVYQLQIDVARPTAEAESLQSSLADATFSNFLDLHNELLPIAAEFALSYSNPERDFDIASLKVLLDDAALNYGYQNQTAFSQYLSDKQNLTNSDIYAFTDNFTPSELGWVGLGATYWLNTSNFGQQERLRAALKIQNVSTWDDSIYELDDLLALWPLLKQITGSYSGEHGGQVNTLAEINEEKENRLKEIVQTTASILQSGNDPLYNLMQIGHTYLYWADIFEEHSEKLTGTAAGLEALAANTESKLQRFTQGQQSGQVASHSNQIILIIISLYCVAMYYAYWLPALPLIHWLSAAISAILALAEVIVLAPVHALSHIFREGNGVAGRRAFEGYGIILGALMRVPLLVISFLLAYPLLIGGGYLVSFLLIPFFSTQPSGSVVAIVSFLGIALVIGAIYSTIIERAFSVMHEITDRSVRMLGFSATNIGGGQFVNAGKGQFQSVSQQITRQKSMNQS
jgi:hypothetical protein